MFWKTLPNTCTLVALNQYSNDTKQSEQNTGSGEHFPQVLTYWAILDHVCNADPGFLGLSANGVRFMWSLLPLSLCWKTSYPTPTPHPALWNGGTPNPLGPGMKVWPRGLRVHVSAFGSSLLPIYRWVMVNSNVEKSKQRIIRSPVEITLLSLMRNLKFTRFCLLA